MSSNIALCQRIITFQGAELVQYYESIMADNFRCVFGGGTIKLDKAGMIGFLNQVQASFPDFHHLCPTGDFKESAGGSVTMTFVAKGTHTGDPWSPMPGVVEAVPAKGVKCQNDPEKVICKFKNGKLVYFEAVEIPVLATCGDGKKGGIPLSGPVGFYLQIGGDLKNLPPPPNVALIKEVCDKALGSGFLAWHEKNCSDDNFQAVFAGGAVVLNKEAYLGLARGIIQSFPDFRYTCPSGDFEEVTPGIVTATYVVKGTHTGSPFSPMPGKVPAVEAKAVAVKCQNDAEAVTFTVKNGKLTRFVVDMVPGGDFQKLVPGGRGFSGPVGFYLQIGGNAKNLPQLAGPPVMSPTFAWSHQIHGVPPSELGTPTCAQQAHLPIHKTSASAAPVK